ncbi:hypothetical protein [Chryseobacterium sp. ON_d1]|uniref:hypothetical protein n=1 Tax=Chryseobacterium sp. ON_d1 TaxID=2583211 RepID=UPI00115B7DB3|nr:hypothetical protein [Chryseobacterium sp. ON_d1]
MEENNLIPREKLKNYFETGKYPTEGQFSDLIDSLRHKEDILTNDEMVAFANNLASIKNGFIIYNLSGGIKGQKFPIVISSQDREDQVIMLGESGSYRFPEGKRYFFGSAPYTVRTKEFSADRLEENQYYVLTSEVQLKYSIARMFGNNLPTIPDGFEFGILEGDEKWFYLQVDKQDFGRKISIVNTVIKFINKTEIPIQYRTSAINWSDKYRSKDIVTDHYDIWDDLAIYYEADLTATDDSVVCRIYDEDKDRILTVCQLDARRYNHDVWAGDQVFKIRNIRIECEYGILNE